MIDQIDTAIAELELELERLQSRLEAWRTLRQLYSDEPTTSTNVATPAATSPSPGAADGVDCPDCGRRLKSPAGMGAHRAAHRRAAKATRSSSSAKREDPASVYECADCGETRATIEGLSAHTYSHHQRPSKIVERTPKVPANAGAAA